MFVLSTGDALPAAATAVVVVVLGEASDIMIEWTGLVGMARAVNISIGRYEPIEAVQVASF